MSGMDVLDALSAQGREILTIMITAYATFETAVKATKLGAYDFLAKPFSPEELRYARAQGHRASSSSAEQARKLAEEKRQVRFNFISVLAHELKAPLNAIEGYLNILRTTEADQNLQMIERSIVRVDGMKKLIFDLLDLTRIESGQRERVVKRLDLRELAKASIELFAVDAERRGITVTLERRRRRRAARRPRRGRDRPQQPRLQRGQVQPRRRQRHGQARAARATPSRITVTDTGIGLTPEEAAKLFNEFMRIKNEQTVKILGSGLGLSHGAQARQHVRRRGHGQERAGRGQHLHRHPARRAAGRLRAAARAGRRRRRRGRRRSSEAHVAGRLRARRAPPVSHVCEDVRY